MFGGRTMRGHTIAGLVAGALALVLAAGAVRAEDGGYVLTIENHRFSPEVLEVPAGEKIRLVVRNLDQTPEEFESHDLKREKIVPGGGEIIVPVGPLEPGSYSFFGEFNPKTAQGRLVAK